MARNDEPLEVVDSSGLTDDDWAKINRLRDLYESGGPKALSKAFRELAEADPIKCVHIMGALFPDMIRETVKDHLAENGMTEDDLRELGRVPINALHRLLASCCGVSVAAEWHITPGHLGGACPARAHERAR